MMLLLVIIHYCNMTEVRYYRRTCWKWAGKKDELTCRTTHRQVYDSWVDGARSVDVSRADLQDERWMIDGDAAAAGAAGAGWEWSKVNSPTRRQRDRCVAHQSVSSADEWTINRGPEFRGIRHNDDTDLTLSWFCGQHKVNGVFLLSKQYMPALALCCSG